MKDMKGLFCHNFDQKRDQWPPWFNVWCGKCYCDIGGVEFHVAMPENDEGVVWEKKAN